jgi:Cu/Ag efflux pump CusA
MTSFAFILGVLPLMIASGAGAASRHSIGTGVFAGMLFATSIGIFFIPLFFRVIRGLAEGRGRPMQQPRHGVIAPSLPEREPAVRI